MKKVVYSAKWKKGKPENRNTGVAHIINVGKAVFLDFKYAIERLHRVLYEYKITGIKNNINYLKSIIGIPDFIEGKYDTGFIAKHAGTLQNGTAAGKTDTEDIALIAAYIDYIVNLEENSPDRTDSRPTNRWRNFGLHKGILRI